jgi:hypothetical protein
LIADKGFDNDDFRAELAAAEVDAAILPLASRISEIAYDENAYGLRYLMSVSSTKSSTIAASLHATKRRRRILVDGEPRRRYDLAQRLIERGGRKQAVLKQLEAAVPCCKPKRFGTRQE